MLKYKLALGLSFVSSAAFATIDVPDMPLPILGAGGPVAIGVAAAGYVGYRLYKRSR